MRDIIDIDQLDKRADFCNHVTPSEPLIKIHEKGTLFLTLYTIRFSVKAYRRSLTNSLNVTLELISSG